MYIFTTDKIAVKPATYKFLKYILRLMRAVLYCDKTIPRPFNLNSYGKEIFAIFLLVGNSEILPHTYEKIKSKIIFTISHSGSL